MQTIKRENLVIGWLFALLFLPGFLPAQDSRTLPVDMYLIVEASSLSQGANDEGAAWIGKELIDRLLKDGDRVSLWSVGAQTQLVFSGTLEGAGGKDAVKAKLKAIGAPGAAAPGAGAGAAGAPGAGAKSPAARRSALPDFSGALREAASRPAGEGGRISYTVLVSASAASLAPALTGKDAALFRWSRAEEYPRFNVLVVAPDIHKKVQQAAVGYMNSGR
jgi:hypothetical protein